MLVVFVGGLFGRRDDTRRVGVITAVGVVALFYWSLRLGPGTSYWDGAYALDELALFAKRLFLVATGLGVLGSLTLRAPVFARRATEYYLIMLSSLLGMLALASARDLILLFVAFELMSIPLYALAGFQKREGEAVEAALKFFLVGTVSSALIAYGLSFVYGVTRTTHIDGIGPALAGGSPLLILGLVITLGGLGFKIAAFPFHMWVPDTYEAANAPFVAWLSVAPEGRRLRGDLPPVPRGRRRPRGAVGAHRHRAGRPHHRGRQPHGHPAAEHQAPARVLGRRPHRLHAGGPRRGVGERRRHDALLPGRLPLREHGGLPRGGGGGAVGGLRQHLQRIAASPSARPMLALAMLLFLLSLGGIPFVAGFWAKLYVFWAAAEKGLYLLVLVGAILTVVALFYYLLVAKRMYIDPPERPDPIAVPPLLALGILICGLGVVVMGIYPKPFVLTALRVAATIF